MFLFRVGRQFSMSPLCFCSTRVGFYSRLSVQCTVLEDRHSVSLKGRVKIWLLSSIIKIMFLSRAMFEQVCSNPLVRPRFRKLMVPHLWGKIPVCLASPVGLGQQGEWWKHGDHATYCATGHEVLCFWPCSLMSSSNSQETGRLSC